MEKTSEGRLPPGVILPSSY